MSHFVVKYASNNERVEFDLLNVWPSLGAAMKSILWSSFFCKIWLELMH